MTALLKLTSVANVTYGTDYPYFPTDQNTALRKLGLKAEDVASIEHRNASRLIRDSKKSEIKLRGDASSDVNLGEN